MYKCKEAGCSRLVGNEGYCRRHCAEHCIDPETGERITPPSTVEEMTQADPRETFECPHCGCALASNEVELPCCPICEKQLHTHVGQDGAVFTPEEASRFGQVTNMDGDLVQFGVDALILAAIDEALLDLRASWLTDLSGLPAGRAICETYRKLDALQRVRG